MDNSEKTNQFAANAIFYKAFSGPEPKKPDALKEKNTIN